MLPKLALEIMKVAHPVRIFSKLATKCRLDFTHCLIAKQPSLGILEIFINPSVRPEQLLAAVTSYWPK